MATETIQVTGDEDLKDVVNRLIERVQTLETELATLQEWKATGDGKTGTKYVSASSGGAVTDEIKFTNGLLTTT